MQEVNGRFRIGIVSAYGVQNTDLRGLSDPYCVLTVDGQKLAKTHVVDDDLSPVWNTVVCLYIQGRANLDSTVFNFSVFDEDRFTSDDFLGHYELTLAELMSKSVQGSHSYMLASRKLRRDKVTGAITLDVKFEPNAPVLDSDHKWHFQNGKLRPGGINEDIRPSFSSHVHDKLSSFSGSTGL